MSHTHTQKIPKLVLQKWKMIWWNEITVSVGISIFENFAAIAVVIYLFIYKDRTDSWYAHALKHTPCNDFNDFTATHGLMVVEMFCSFLFCSALFCSVRFAFVCALRAILKLKISTNTHTIRIEYHNKYFTKRKCFLPTSPFIGRIIFGILINCFKNDGWSSNVINASSSMFAPEYGAGHFFFL